MKATYMIQVATVCLDFSAQKTKVVGQTNALTQVFTISFPALIHIEHCVLL